MSNIKIKKTDGAEESVELLAASILQVAQGYEAMLKSPLKDRTIIVLLHDYIGAAKISKQQIKLVIEALPRLKAWYLK